MQQRMGLEAECERMAQWREFNVTYQVLRDELGTLSQNKEEQASVPYTNCFSDELAPIPTA
jgi:hypothetical protein